MNIQKIYGTQINTVQLPMRTANVSPQFGIKMSKPLDADTISFQGRGIKIVEKEVMAAIARKDARALRDARQIAEVKKAPDKTAPTKKNLSGEERKWGVSKSTAKQIRSMILEPQKQVHNFMERIFGDLKVSELSPKNIILKTSDRAKSVISIMEKSSTREWNSIKENLENMTDLNGAKIVFNYKTGRQEAETALDRLIPLIKTKQVILKEIELQRPEAIKGYHKKDQEEFDYVSKIFLDKLEDVQEEVINGLETNPDKIKLIERPLPKYTKGNYCALHLILQLAEKDSRPFELQIMGARMSDGKAFDDKRFKFFDGKELDKMYAPLIDLWGRLLPDENAAAKERFLQYCKDANLQLREDEIQENRTQRLINRPGGFFKSVRNYGLTPEYDLNAQYKLMRQCENNADTKKKAETEVSVKGVPFAKSIEEKIETTLTQVERKVKDLTKGKIQVLVAKYSPKTKKTNGVKKKNK